MHSLTQRVVAQVKRPLPPHTESSKAGDDPVQRPDLTKFFCTLVPHLIDTKIFCKKLIIEAEEGSEGLLTELVERINEVEPRNMSIVIVSVSERNIAEAGSSRKARAVDDRRGATAFTVTPSFRELIRSRSNGSTRQPRSNRTEEAEFVNDFNAIS